jgi:hypothetical protein
VELIVPGKSRLPLSVMGRGITVAEDGEISDHFGRWNAS